MDKSSKPITVVLAEDEPIIATAYKQGLSYYGFNVVLAVDGQEAIVAIEKEQPDILLLDIIMPNMNGVEVLQVLNKRPVRPGLPVIVLSNLSQPEEADLVSELGARAYLIKANLSLKELVAQINDAVGTSPA